MTKFKSVFEVKVSYYYPGVCGNSSHVFNVLAWGGLDAVDIIKTGLLKEYKIVEFSSFDILAVNELCSYVYERE
jgi:hypothetical protein